MSSQLTYTAIEKAKRVFLALFGVGVAWTFLVAFVALLTGRTFAASLDPAFIIFQGVLLLWLVGSWLLGRRGRGELLLDCGPNPDRWMYLFLAATWVYLMLLDAPALSELFFTSAGLKTIVPTTLLLTLATGRVQVYEGGIWNGHALLRWHNLISYHFADDGTLITRTKSFLPTNTAKVPLEHQAASERILLEHVPQIYPA